jgi:hypothetical protein
MHAYFPVHTADMQLLFLLLQYIRNPISTLCVGQAASMASLLLAAGERGQRRSLPNSRIMLHQPSGGFQARGLQLLACMQSSICSWCIAEPLQTSSCRGRPATSGYMRRRSTASASG